MITRQRNILRDNSHSAQESVCTQFTFLVTTGKCKCLKELTNKKTKNKFIKRPTNALGFMNVLLLHSNHRHIQPLMWPSSGWWEQEYKYNYNASKSLHSYNSYSPWFFNCGVTLTYYKCICILVLTTLKMVTWGVKTCQWLLFNKTTYIIQEYLLVLLINFTHLINAQNMEHMKWWTNYLKNSKEWQQTRQATKPETKKKNG